MAEGDCLTQAKVVVGKHGVEGAIGCIFVGIEENNEAFPVLAPFLETSVDVSQ
jgi:ammonia channel protein AmtB